MTKYQKVINVLNQINVSGYDNLNRLLGVMQEIQRWEEEENGHEANDSPER